MLRLALLSAWVAFGCSLLVDTELEHVGCRDEGAIGPPACDVGQVCGQGECRQCVLVDACGDGVDNDCSGTVDDGCQAAGAGGR